MTNYHPDVQRAYDAHCADGYVVPDDETGPQEATGGAVRDFPCCDEPRDGEAAERRTEGLSVVERAAMILGRDGNPPQLGAAMALADAGLLVSEDARGALDETLDDLTRTLARAEKAEAEVARYQRLVSWHEWHGSDAEARAAELEAAWREACEVAGKGADRKAEVEAERDRARDTAAALEAEVARLTAKVERVEVLAATLGKEARSMSPCTGPNCGGCVRGRDAAHIRAALSDTTGDAS